MSVLRSSDFIATWAARMQAAAGVYPSVAFDGRTALPTWLAESARDQAERLFLVFDGTPVDRRDMAMAERMHSAAGTAFLEAWGWLMATFGSDDEPWAAEAAKDAVLVYNTRLNELAPGLHSGGVA